jgi:4-hydroxy-tetrahydrodipicolinate reductase
VKAADDLELVAGVSRSDATSFSTVEEALDTVPTDVLVDYAHAEAVKGHVLAALDRRVAIVIGSSGLSAVDFAEIDIRAREQGWASSPPATSRSARRCCFGSRRRRRATSRAGR